MRFYLKIVNILLGQQSGYTEQPRFICLWYSRDDDQHWRKKDWPARDALVVRQKNITNESLVNRDRIIFPPLHTKLA